MNDRKTYRFREATLYVALKPFYDEKGYLLRVGKIFRLSAKDYYSGYLVDAEESRTLKDIFQQMKYVLRKTIKEKQDEIFQFKTSL